MVGGSKSAEGGPYPLADLDRGGSKSASRYGPGVQIRGGSKSAVTPANNGCGKDSVSHAIIKRNFGDSTRDVTGKIAPFKMANVSNLEELLQSENGLLRKNKWYLWCT